MSRPPAGAYDPYITIASPGGKPSTKPRFRILMSKSLWKAWENAIGQAGDQNVQQLWNHLAYRPDKPPLLVALPDSRADKPGEKAVGLAYITTRSQAPVESTTSSTRNTAAGRTVTLIRLSRSSASICPATDGAKCAAALGQTLGCAHHPNAV